MRSKIILLVALLCISAFAQTNSCQSFYPNDLLQTGKAVFMRMRSNDRELKFDNPVSYPIPSSGFFQVAATAGTIGDYDPTSRGFSFEISGRRKPGQNFVEFSLVTNSDGWTTIQVSYLVSSRNDFAVGNYQFPINTWGKTNNADIYDLTYNIGRSLPEDKYQVVAFISGFSTTDTQFQISINNRSFNSRSRVLTLTLFCNASPRPSSITISYVIYPSDHVAFDISYGVPLGDANAYQISGPTSFPNNYVIQYNEFRIGNRFLSCSGNQCENTCMLRERCVELDGNIYQGRCYFCSPGVIFQYGLCTRKCGPNQSYRNRVCLCDTGFVRNGNKCVSNQACRDNQLFWNGACRRCPGGASLSNDKKTCECRNGRTYDINTNTCNLVCGSGEVLENDRCVCARNFGRVGGVCQQCPPGATSNSRQECVCPSNLGYNSQTNQCTSRCTNGQIWNGNACVCPSNSINFNNQCRQCPANSNPNGAQNTCVCTRNGETYDRTSNRCSTTRCPTGQVLYKGACVCDGWTSGRTCRKCPSNAKPDFEANTCSCPQGTRFDANNNQCVARCSTAQVWRNNRCECLDGYARWNGACRQCPKSSAPTSDDSTCQCFSKNSIYISQTNICVDCGANSIPNNARTACVCKSGFRKQGNSCVPDIQCQFNQDFVNGQCKCKFGYKQLGPVCVEICGINQFYDKTLQCFCKEGTARIRGVCRVCPAGSAPNSAKNTCLCNDPNQIFVFDNNRCETCPQNSLPNSDDTSCTCNPGYTKSGSSCVSNCPSDATPNSQGQCVCSGGKIFNAGQCITPSSCPAGSTFNLTTLSCVCNSRNEHIIDGACKACGVNSVWSKDKCVCSTGFFLIGAECRTCDPRTKYDGKDCVCNLGFFGNRDLCTPCHKSCSQCTGPQADKCTACSDISLVLEKGFCAKNTPCGLGFFVDAGGCTKCTDYCIDCNNQFECTTCAVGFAPKKETFNGQQIVSCVQVCGDGIKFEQACDDGNTLNGDGCSSTCQEESGWFCSGGSSAKPSTCKKFIPDQIQLSARGSVNMNGQILQAVRASYLPECITKNQCADCFKLLQVNVVSSLVPLSVIVQYVAFSQWQFIIKFDFQGLFVSSIIKVVIKLNEQFRGCIPDEDYNEQLQLEIDPAFLAKIDNQGQLDINEISLNPNSNKIIINPEASKLLGV